MRTSAVESLRSRIAGYEREIERNCAFKPHLEETISYLRKELQTLEVLTREFEAFGLGFTVKHAERESWASILPDASYPGFFRWQEFGADGFISHSTHRTTALCLEDLVKFGFATPDPGALERLCGTAQWRKGSEITAVIQASNSGLLSWEEANQRYQEIQAAFDKEVA